jgi:hypothetical protein
MLGFVPEVALEVLLGSLSNPYDSEYYSSSSHIQRTDLLTSSSCVLNAAMFMLITVNEGAIFRSLSASCRYYMGAILFLVTFN